MKLMVNSSTLGLWQDVIHEAENTCEITLKHDLEAYLALLLTRFTTKPEMSKKILATDFLESLELRAHQREISLQEIGDTCLIFSGLFPGIAAKKLVKISYFTNLGRTAYDSISKKHNDIFSSLSQQFISIMDILQSLRLYSKDNPDLLPLQAYDLWNETNSQRALKVLKQYTKATPVNIILMEKETCRFQIKK